MKTRYIIGMALALMMAGSCQKGKEIEPEVKKNFDYGLSVRNLDYTEEVVLDGVGLTTLVSAENLPAWITGVTLRETLSQGNSVALVSIKGDNNLDEEREAAIVLKMGNGATVKLKLIQWPFLKEKENEEYKSVNTAFEADWLGTKKITLVLKKETSNGKTNTYTDEVSLPWDFDHLPACYLPKGGADELNKMIEDKDDWSLVFNLTGIYKSPNDNYFGLYNRYLGILRVFYYFTQDLVPTEASDHMWAFALNRDLAEHISAQFSIPYEETVTGPIKDVAARPVLISPTTDHYNPLLSESGCVPAIGWWAFDVNMTALRKDSFFNHTLSSSAININLCTYNKKGVFLNSILQGTLSGHVQGTVNLDQLAPMSTSGWAKVVSPILSTGASVAMNTYVLKEGFSQSAGAGNNHQVNNNQPAVLPDNPPANIQLRSVTAGAVISIVVGSLLSLAAKYIDTYGKQKVVDQNLGALNATMNLDLNAMMTTEGTIGGPISNTVPPASMTMGYIKQNNPDGTPTGLGDGIWNLNNHPVIYVVKDAYWYENNFKAFKDAKSPNVEYPLNGEDVYSYDLGGTKGSRPGLRLISFLDPTSIGGVSFNEKLFDGGIDKIRVYLSYGVYPGSTPGYSDAFRQAAKMDYQRTWSLFDRTSKKEDFDSARDLKLIKKPHTDELFKWTKMDPEIKDVAAYRLCSQKLRTDHPGLERRYFGASMYYSKPYATDFDVDQVQFVYDPQIYVPFDDAGHRIYDPQVPDLVVSAAIFGYGKDSKDNEPATLTNTLRFLPKVVLISYKDLPTVYEKIQNNKKKITGPKNTTTEYVDMESQIRHIGDIVDAVK